MLEAKIRQIVEERFGAGPIPAQTGASTSETTQQVSNDILDMLSDLDCFS